MALKDISDAAGLSMSSDSQASQLIANVLAGDLNANANANGSMGESAYAPLGWSPPRNDAEKASKLAPSDESRVLEGSFKENTQPSSYDAALPLDHDHAHIPPPSPKRNVHHADLGRRSPTRQKTTTTNLRSSSSPAPPESSPEPSFDRPSSPAKNRTPKAAASFSSPKKGTTNAVTSLSRSRTEPSPTRSPSRSSRQRSPSEEEFSQDSIYGPLPKNPRMKAPAPRPSDASTNSQPSQKSSDSQSIPGLGFSPGKTYVSMPPPPSTDFGTVLVPNTDSSSQSQWSEGNSQNTQSSGFTSTNNDSQYSSDESLRLTNRDAVHVYDEEDLRRAASSLGPPSEPEEEEEEQDKSDEMEPTQPLDPTQLDSQMSYEMEPTQLNTQRSDELEPTQLEPTHVFDDGDGDGDEAEDEDEDDSQSYERTKQRKIEDLFSSRPNVPSGQERRLLPPPRRTLRDGEGGDRFAHNFPQAAMLGRAGARNGVGTDNVGGASSSPSVVPETAQPSPAREMTPPPTPPPQPQPKSLPGPVQGETSSKLKTKSLASTIQGEKRKRYNLPVDEKERATPLVNEKKGLGSPRRMGEGSKGKGKGKEEEKNGKGGESRIPADVPVERAETRGERSRPPAPAPVERAETKGEQFRPPLPAQRTGTKGGGSRLPVPAASAPAPAPAPVHVPAPTKRTGTKPKAVTPRRRQPSPRPIPEDSPEIVPDSQPEKGDSEPLSEIESLSAGEIGRGADETMDTSSSMIVNVGRYNSGFDAMDYVVGTREGEPRRGETGGEEDFDEEEEDSRPLADVVQRRQVNSGSATERPVFNRPLATGRGQKPENSAADLPRPCPRSSGSGAMINQPAVASTSRAQQKTRREDEIIQSGDARPSPVPVAAKPKHKGKGKGKGKGKATIVEPVDRSNEKDEGDVDHANEEKVDKRPRSNVVRPSLKRKHSPEPATPVSVSRKTTRTLSVGGASTSTTTRATKRLRTTSFVAYSSGTSTRVFAPWRKDYYAGTVHLLADASSRQYVIHFDDGLEETVPISRLRRCELRAGDEVRVQVQGGYKPAVVVGASNNPSATTPVQLAYKAGRGSSPFHLEVCHVKVLEKSVKVQWADRMVDEASIVPKMVSVPVVPPVSPSLGSHSSHDGRSAPAVSSSRILEGMAFVVAYKTSAPLTEHKELVASIPKYGGVVYTTWEELLSVKGPSQGRWTIVAKYVKWKGSSNIKKLFLLSDHCNTKPKYLMALALGVPCVNVEWLSMLANEEFNPHGWANHLLPAGELFKSDRPVILSQLVDFNWGRWEMDLQKIMESPIAPKVFAGKTILCIGDRLIPSAKEQDNASVNEVPRVILAMGASVVLCVKKLNAVNKKDLSEDCINYVVLEGTETPASVQKKAGWDVQCGNVEWIKACLISSKLLPVAARIC